MSNIKLNFYKTTISAGSTRQQLTEALKNITDEDYNGNNGEDYFYHDASMSNLEYMVKNLYETKTIPEIIEAVIKDNFENNNYYGAVEYHIEDMIGDDYFVVVAAIS